MCAYATMSDRVVREVSENLFHLSPFREGDGAAMCRRPPRGLLDIASRAAPGTAFESTECEALTCFRGAEYSGGYFWFRLFRKKAE